MGCCSSSSGSVTTLETEDDNAELRAEHLKIHALSACPVLLHLNRPLLAAFAALFTGHNLPAGHEVVCTGDKVEQLFFIGDGEVVLSVDTGDAMTHSDSQSVRASVSRQARRSPTPSGLILRKESFMSGTSSAVARKLATRKTGQFVVHRGQVVARSHRHHSRPKWRYTVTTLTECFVLSASLDDMGRFILEHPEMRDIMRALNDPIVNHLNEVPLFRGLQPSDHHLVASVLTPRVLEPNEILFREGDVGTSMFVVYDGSVKAVTEEPDGSQRVMQEFLPGQFFGEIALMVSIPRTATIQAGTERTLLLELLKDDFERFASLQGGFGPLAANVEIVLKQSVLEHFRKYQIPFWSAIPKDKFGLLAAVSQIVKFEKGDLLFGAQEIADYFYVVVWGEVALSTNCIKSRRRSDTGSSIDFEVVQPGQYFGLEVLQNAKDPTAAATRVANAVAESTTVVVQITSEGMRSVLQQVPEALATFELELARYDLKLRTVLHNKIGYQYFSQHLESEYNEENLHFWRDTGRFARRFAQLARCVTPPRAASSTIRETPVSSEDHELDSQIHPQLRRIATQKAVPLRRYSESEPHLARAARLNASPTGTPPFTPQPPNRKRATSPSPRAKGRMLTASMSSVPSASASDINFSPRHLQSLSALKSSPIAPHSPSITHSSVDETTADTGRFVGSPAEFYQAMKDEAQRIIELYLVDDAPEQIMIRSDMRHSVVESFDSSQPPEKCGAHSSMFAEARTETLRLLSEDAYPRFKATALFREFLDHYEERRKKGVRQAHRHHMFTKRRSEAPSHSTSRASHTLSLAERKQKVQQHQQLRESKRWLHAKSASVGAGPGPGPARGCLEKKEQSA